MEKKSSKYRYNTNHWNKNWWDPTYKKTNEELEEEIFLNNTSGKSNIVEKIVKGLDQNENQLFIKGVSFKCCDFIGEFYYSGQVITIENCLFEYCCFESSVWVNIKFRNCEFRGCTFNITEFRECIFDKNVKFSDTAFSSHYLKMHNTEIWSSKFSRSGFIQDEEILNKEIKKAKPLLYQKMRLKSTSAKVAFSIMQSVKALPDSEVYVDAAKTYLILNKEYIIEKYKYEIYTGKTVDRLKSMAGYVIAHLELLFVKATGFVGGWGMKVFRPCLFMALSTLCFSLIYSCVYDANLLSLKFLTSSLNISLFLGVGGDFLKMNPELSSIYYMQSFVSIWLYVIIINSLVVSISKRV